MSLVPLPPRPLITRIRMTRSLSLPPSLTPLPFRQNNKSFHKSRRESERRVTTARVKVQASVIWLNLILRPMTPASSILKLLQFHRKNCTPADFNDSTDAALTASLVITARCSCYRNRRRHSRYHRRTSTSRRILCVIYRRCLWELIKSATIRPRKRRNPPSLCRSLGDGLSAVTHCRRHGFQAYEGFTGEGGVSFAARPM